MKATLTPAPSTMFCACGVAGSLNAVCVVCSASGSSSGLAGSVGQIVLVVRARLRLCRVWIGFFADGPALTSSGKIGATDGSEAS